MKRLFLFTILMCLAVIGAEKIKPWEVTTQEQVDAMQSTDKWAAQNYLKANTSDYQTYEEFKSQFNPAYRIMVAHYINKYNKFIPDVVADESVDTISRVMHYKFLNLNEAWLVANAPEAVKLATYSQTDKILKMLNSISFADTEKMKECLKKIKRVIYPKIQESEDWKVVNVKLELMLKSFE